MQGILYRGIVAGAAFAIIGCFRSPTARFFTLSPHIEQSQSSVLSPQGARVALVSLTLPSYVLDPRMSVIAEGNEVLRDEFERWAEDLDENFRRVFLDDLSRQLGSSNVYTSDAVAPQPGALLLRADVLRFDTDTDRMARLRVRWSLSSEGAAPSFVISEWTESFQEESSAARVKAMSALVASLAREVAAKVTSLAG